MPNAELQAYLADRLKPAVEAEEYEYEDEPSIDDATGSQIIVLDGTRTTDAVLDTKYDKILALKRSMGKVHDVTCVIGKREDHKKYQRSTYPNMLYFCLRKDDFDHRDPDLPPEGVDTIVGPRLYNLADIPSAIASKIRELSGSWRSSG